MLPEATLNTSCYPLSYIPAVPSNWSNRMSLAHRIKLESQFQNAEKDLLKNDTKLPSTIKWNNYAKSGIHHSIPISMECKIFRYISLTPNFTWDEAWYWEKLFFEDDDLKPIYKPGFNRVFSWSTGCSLQTALYHTHFFNQENTIQGCRIKMVPSMGFTYTPDFSSQKYGYFQKVKKSDGTIHKKYAFQDFLPSKSLIDRASSSLECKLHNSIELKVKKNNSDSEEEKKNTSYKIPLLRVLNLETTYDFKAKQCRFVRGIDMQVASNVDIWKAVKVGFDLNITLDPYLFNTKLLEHGKVQEESIDVFAWGEGKYLGRIKTAQFKLSMDFHPTQDNQKKSSLFSREIDKLDDPTKDEKIDFGTPWNISCEYHSRYNRLSEYVLDAKNYTKNKYLTFSGNVTLVKKWKLNLRGTYDLMKNRLDPDATEMSIQRDLHCWELSYKWHPAGSTHKYDFSLRVKSNALKILKIPRKRTYNKLKA